MSHAVQDDDYLVKDMQNKMWFKLDAKSFSMKKERQLQDASGQVIATISKKVVSLRTTWVCFTRGYLSPKLMHYSSSQDCRTRSFRYQSVPDTRGICRLETSH